MTTPDIRSVLKREDQLNALAYVIITVLLAMIVALIIALATDVAVPDMWILGDQIARTLFVGLLLMFILYLVDQHRRLRKELLETHGRLELANDEITSAYERLSFAQHTASVMTSLAEPNALGQVLSDSTRHFGADVAAVIGEEITLYAEPGVEKDEAESAVLQVALEAVRAGKAMAMTENAHAGKALAVPLRIRGELKSVVCLWRRDDDFSTDQLEGLILMARIIELSLENRILLGGVRDQLAGTLHVLSGLIDQRLPDYRRHSTRMAEHAVAVGRALGMNHKDISDLRIAALLSDVGMLQVPEKDLREESPTTPEASEAVKAHPTLGAQVAKSANFSPSVQDAIHDHHERLDGSGYPRARKGDAIQLAARILAVCDVYDSLTTPRPGRPRTTPAQAIATLMRGAGAQFDAEVVRAFLQMVGRDATGVTDRREPDSTLVEIEAVQARSS